MHKDLYEALESVMREKGTTYGEAIDALKRLLVTYQIKGSNLLNEVNIQEVTRARFLVGEINNSGDDTPCANP